MTAPSEERVLLEFSVSPAKRRAPKKLQDIGIGQFKRQGVAHHIQPNSAAAQLNKQKAEQRTEIWLGRGPSMAPVDKPQDKAKGKKKAKTGTKDKKDAATATDTATAHAGVKCATCKSGTGPVNEVEQKKHDEVLDEHVETPKHSQDLDSMAPKAPTWKVIKIVTVSRHVKPIQGTWGHRAVENAKRAAPKIIATTYPTTPITIDVSDGELIATIKPTPKLPSPKPTVPSATVRPRNIPTNTMRKAPVKVRAPKKSQAPMWSDDSQGEQDEQDNIDDLLVSSRSGGSATKGTPSRTVEKSSADDQRRKGTRAQSTSQKRQVRFEPSDRSGDGYRTAPQRKTNPTKKQTSKIDPAKSATSAQTHTSNPQSLSPSHIKENLDPGELSDDEESETHTNAISAKTTATHRTSSAPASKLQRRPVTPARKKGVAGKPVPKRARAAEIDNDMGATAPPNKKAKTSAQPKSTKKDTPVRKEGVATKVARKRTKPVFGDESDESEA